MFTHDPVYPVVWYTSRVGGFWHIGHDAIFSTCYMLVAFGTSDMISCYRHVYRLWSGHDVLYRLFNYQCPHVVSIVLIHSGIFHIVHVHTWCGVCCCQIPQFVFCQPNENLTRWWFLSHWTWRHVFMTCYMLVAFGASDMISCYWHVYHLWSGQDVLYRLFNYQCLCVVSIVLIHSVILHLVHVHTCSGVSVYTVSEIPHVMVVSGTLDLTPCFLYMFNYLPYGSHRDCPSAFYQACQHLVVALILCLTFPNIASFSLLVSLYYMQRTHHVGSTHAIFAVVWPITPIGCEDGLRRMHVLCCTPPFHHHSEFHTLIHDIYSSRVC